MGSIFSQEKNLNLSEFKTKMELIEKKRKEQKQKNIIEEKNELSESSLNLILNSEENKEKIKKILKKISKKKLIIILGNTGSGKSTLTNYLLELELKNKKDKFNNEIIDLKNEEKNYSKIGHNLSKSETQNINFFQTEKFNLLDCQGFLDSREIEMEIKFLLLLEDIFQNYESVKFIITIDYYSILSCRAKLFKDIFVFFIRLFCEENTIVENKNSIFVLITKQKKIIRLKDFKNTILSFNDKIFEKLIDRFFFYNPIDSLEIKEDILDRKKFFKELNSMKFIKEKKYEVSFNYEQKECIDNIFKFIQNEIILNCQINENEGIIKSFQKLDFFKILKMLILKIKLEMFLIFYIHDLKILNI